MGYNSGECVVCGQYKTMRSMGGLCTNCRSQAKQDLPPSTACPTCDRLAAENAIYKDRLNVLDRHCEDGIRIDVAALCSQLEDHRETLDRLREVVPEVPDGYVKAIHMDIEAFTRQVQAILYSKETTNEDR